MAEFKPFLGLRYDENVVGPLSNVTAPPYDVINAADVLLLHASSPYNITHLTRPIGDDAYTIAYKTFSQWKADGALATDADPAFYIYRQQFTDPDDPGQTFERVGIVGLLKVEDYSSGKVLPHENTLAAARVDRLNLLRSTHANLESIYGLYSDPSGAVKYALQSSVSHNHVVAVVDNAIGSSHTLEVLTDSDAIELIRQYLEMVPIFIADGHHRYETSLNFSKERPDLIGADYILITLTAFEDAGLLVLPTHRVLRGFDNGEIEVLPARLIERGFDVTISSHQESELKPGEFILITREAEYAVAAPKGKSVDELVPGSSSSAWKSLDVSILHTLIIGEILELPLNLLSTTDKVSYTRDVSEARRKVASGEAQAAFILARPTVEQIKLVSEAGDKMPQKSTFFYPKLLSGLVLYDFDK